MAEFLTVPFDFHTSLTSTTFSGCPFEKSEPKRLIPWDPISNCSEVPMPSDNSIISRKQLLHIILEEILRLTLLTTFVDLIFAVGHAHLVIFSALVENLSGIWVCIIDANNSMSPRTTENSITLAQESLLSLELVQIRQLISECLYFLASLFRRLKVSRRSLSWAGRIIIEESGTHFFKHLHVLRSSWHELRALGFKH